ncbi:PRC-barrel domain containing protein [Candidatus Poribacteria bacterium]|nr:PRC-barrel domain containing protein [Candidatus Poribacteria bacterium]
MSIIKGHHNKLIISITDGKKLGEVKDLYLDEGMNKMVAVFLGKEGLISRKSLVIEPVFIKVYGIDAWLVSGSYKVTDVAEITGADKFLLASDFQGREIQSEGGTKIGTVEDVVLDAEANVLGFTLGKVYVQGPIAERKAIARAAITSFGSKNSPMTTLLEKAEALELPNG